MNRRGHLWFATIVGLLTIYILKDFMILPYRLLLFHSPFYFLGTAYILDHWFFDNYKLGISHRGFWHSRFFSWLLIFLLIPISIKYYLTYPKKMFWGVQFNYFSILGSVLIGMLVHIFADSLTSKLRNM